MNTNTILILGVIILLIVGIGYVSTQSPTTGSALSTNESAGPAIDDETMDDAAEPMSGEMTTEEAAVEEMDFTTDDTAETTMDDEMVNETSDTSDEPGVYTDYSTEAIASSEADTKLIFFHATWCPSCRALDSNITDSLTDIPSDVAIFKADYDSEIALRQTYGVTVQHTIVQVDDAGNQLKKWSGRNTLEGVLAEL